MPVRGRAMHAPTNKHIYLCVVGATIGRPFGGAERRAVDDYFAENQTIYSARKCFHKYIKTRPSAGAREGLPSSRLMGRVHSYGAHLRSP